MWYCVCVQRQTVTVSETPSLQTTSYHFKQNNGFSLIFSWQMMNSFLIMMAWPCRRHHDTGIYHPHVHWISCGHSIWYCFPVEKPNFEVLYKQSPLQFLRRLTFACKFILHASAKNDGFHNKNDELHACGCRILPVLRLGQVFYHKINIFIEACLIL